MIRERTKTKRTMKETSNLLNKYFQRAQSVELKRSEIHFSDYNPRKITEEGEKNLRRSIKTFGVVGGIVVNANTNNTIVGGHQKVAILDELNKYNEQTSTNDYTLRVELVSLDEKEEKELNIILNNPNVGGDWDYDKLRNIIPDIDYKSVGLSDADLAMVGVDFDAINEEAEKLQKQIEDDLKIGNTDNNIYEDITAQINDSEQRKENIKQAKERTKEQAKERAEQMLSYVTFSFNSYERLTEFCNIFDLDPNLRFVDGDAFLDEMQDDEDETEEGEEEEETNIKTKGINDINL